MGELTGKRHSGTLFDDVNVHILVGGVITQNVYIYKNLLNCALKIATLILLYVNYPLVKLISENQKHM